MVPGQQAPVPRHCPRCTGPIYRSQEAEYSCLYCGEYLFVEAQRTVERIALVREGPRKRGRLRKHPGVA